MNLKNQTPLFGPYGSAAMAYLDQFAEYGANALWFHGFDPAAFEACQAQGIAPCVEFKTFRADFATHPELIPTGADGKPIRYDSLVQGVCLSQGGFLAETEEHLIAGITAFQPAGIWLDYLTYAGWFETPEPDLQESCFCRACIAEFCQATGIDAETSGQILESHAQAWMAHKCKRVAGFARSYADLIRQRLPGCIVGAYMCPWTPDEFAGALRRIFAQDYNLLAPAIDVFTPLIYCAKSGRPHTWGKTWLEQASQFVPPERQVQVILDALDYPGSLLETAKATRPGWGLQLFGGAKVYADRTQAKIFRQAVEQIQERMA